MKPKSPRLYHMGKSTGLYEYHDLSALQGTASAQNTYSARLRSMDDLLERDRLREQDGFPRKIRIGRLIKPGKGGRDNVVIVPTTVEEKFIHESYFGVHRDGKASGGSGEGEEGEVIGEEPVREPGISEDSGSGHGEDGAHELESSAYDLGKILTENFQLPNLKEKGKKRSFTRYTYDLTDRNRGYGQILDKKASLRKIIETNIGLGNLSRGEDIDPGLLAISPNDRVYRILSREKDYASQAMVFFLRDYSGSMAGKSTEIVVTQHVLIYSWLLYQYARQVETRFILHDSAAREVPDFYTYYNSKVAGGTEVAAAYRLVNNIVEKEDLSRDYNIYVFHGTDGEDLDPEGEGAIAELKRMLSCANRVGITIAEHARGSKNGSEVEKYIKNSGLLDEKPDLLRLDVMKEDADEARLIEGIKGLIS